MAVYQVTVGGKEYEVEITDLSTQPVQAVVNGQTVEVWVKERELKPSFLRGPAAGTAPSLPPPAGAAAGTAPSLPPPAVAAWTPGVVQMGAQQGAALGAAQQEGKNLPGSPKLPGRFVVRAPMPGTIISIAVQPGDQVDTGQDVCVLEAMKMKNRISAPRAGVIDQVHVSSGQQVQQGEVLVTFTQ